MPMQVKKNYVRFPTTHASSKGISALHVARWLCQGISLLSLDVSGSALAEASMRAFHLNENHLEWRRTTSSRGTLWKATAPGAIFAYVGSALRSLVIAVVIGAYFNESPKKISRAARLVHRSCTVVLRLRREGSRRGRASGSHCRRYFLVRTCLKEPTLSRRKSRYQTPERGCPILTVLMEP